MKDWKYCVKLLWQLEVSKTGQVMVRQLLHCLFYTNLISDNFLMYVKTDLAALIQVLSLDNPVKIIMNTNLDIDGKLI